MLGIVENFLFTEILALLLVCVVPVLLLAHIAAVPHLPAPSAPFQEINGWLFPIKDKTVGAVL